MHFAQLHVQRQPSRLDPRHVEQIAHDPLQPPVRGLDFVEECCGERQPGVLQLGVEPFGRRADHRQRRLQFMRHRIQQRVIQPFRFRDHARLLRRLNRAITLDHHRDLRRECIQQIVVIQRPRVAFLEQHPQHSEPMVRGLQRQVHRLRVGQRVGESPGRLTALERPRRHRARLCIRGKRARRVRLVLESSIRRRPVTPPSASETARPLPSPPAPNRLPATRSPSRFPAGDSTPTPGARDGAPRLRERAIDSSCVPSPAPPRRTS